jgi:hypothetical protein
MNQKQRDRLQEAVDILAEIQTQEQEKYDNAPESLQDTDKTQKFSDNADKLQEAIDMVNEVLEV